MNPVLNSYITDMWKKEMSDTLSMIYGDKIDKGKLDEFLENEIRNIKTKPMCVIRNQYEFREFESEANDLPNIIKENNLSILGNGMMTYCIDDRPALQSELIIEMKAARKYHKKLMLEAVANGDENTRKKEFNNQNKKKEDANSIFGGATNNGSFISNIDCGSAITAQGRHLISEVLWNVERLVGANYYYDSINDYMLFVKKALNKTEPSHELSQYVTHIPTFEDCKRRFLLDSMKIDGFTKQFDRTPASFFIFLKNMNQHQRTMFFYKNDIYTLIKLNPRIQEVIKSIYRTNVTFRNPYDVPGEIKEQIDVLTELFKAYTYVNLVTYNRVQKYITKKRRTVLISDTDSVMPCMYEFIRFCMDIVGADRDAESEIKFANTIVTIVDRILQIVCENYVDTANGSINIRQEINFKNELYYLCMIVYSGQKKAYSGICLFQEGKEVPVDRQLMSTGRELTSSSKCQVVDSMIKDIIENDILRVNKIDIEKILLKKLKIENMIREETKQGIMIYGDFCKYKNADQYVNVFSTTTPRVAYIWNELYPDYIISNGVGMYVFKTSLLTIRDLDMIEDSDIRIKLKDIIYNVYGNRDQKVCDELSKFGLKYFGVNEDYPFIPKWIIPFIDVNDVVLKQLRPLIKLEPSIGLNEGLIKNSTLKTDTNMINF